MRPELYCADCLTALLREKTIATMPDLMPALGTSVERTVFRKLSGLVYRTSYSHGGRYYTLDDIARFDRVGLWSYRSVWFSAHGSLVETAGVLVGASAGGYLVDELDARLHVRTKGLPASAGPTRTLVPRRQRWPPSLLLSRFGQARGPTGGSRGIRHRSGRVFCRPHRPRVRRGEGYDRLIPGLPR